MDPVTAVGIHLSQKVSGFINLFTAIETVTLTVWLVILFPDLLKHPILQQVIAVVVLYFGLLLEHTTATKAGILAGHENPNPE